MGHIHGFIASRYRLAASGLFLFGLLLGFLLGFASVFVLGLIFRRFVGARLVGAGPALESALAGPDVADDRAPPKALASLWESPPWFLRGARLLQLAWLPLVVLVVIEAVIRVA